MSFPVSSVDFIEDMCVNITEDINKGLITTAGLSWQQNDTILCNVFSYETNR